MSLASSGPPAEGPVADSNADSPWHDWRLVLLDEGIVDDRDTAFPQAAHAPAGEILCSYSDTGGQFATGGTGLARSADLGRSWRPEGPLGAPFRRAVLRVSATPGAGTLFLYGGRTLDPGRDRFGERPVEAVVSRSADGGRSWSDPAAVPMPTTMLEISHGALPLAGGRVLAPAATIEAGRLGAAVITAVSDDGGRTWPESRVVLADPAGREGFLEQKLTDLGGGRVLATAWTVTLDTVSDRPNSFALSEDSGETWSAPASIGTRGQTFSALGLGGDRLLIAYNRRYGRQGIVAALARLTDADWPVHGEIMVYDAGLVRPSPARDDGVTEMQDFAFGFPTFLRLSDREVLLTYWAGLPGRTAVRWARLRVDTGGGAACVR
jgi:hypothetical protein